LRDAILILAILASIPLIVRHPFSGMLAWAWFTLMTPHQLAYGVYGVPLNMVIASVTIAASPAIASLYWRFCSRSG